MTRTLFIAFLLLFFSGCAQLPPPPEDAAAKRFEAISDKAVIYIVRHALDADFAAPVALDDHMLGTTYRGTYMRIETAAGPHRVRGTAGDNGFVNLATEPGKVYYVKQTANGYRSFVSSTFQHVDATYGQSMVMGGVIAALVRL